MSDESVPRGHTRTPETDEVLRRIGRNVMNFQQVEYLLKYLNTHAAFSAPASGLAARFQKHAEVMDTKTMGDLAGKLVNNVLRLPADEPAGEIDEAWIGFRFSIETDAEFVERHDKEMRALVDARNDLIHHFMLRWQSAVKGDTDGALAYLDAQRDDTMRMMERLQGWAQTVSLGKQQLAEFWSSPEGQRQFDLAFLRSSRLVVMLGEIAMQTPRTDGWTLLSTAGQLIKRAAPAELDDLRKRFGNATLTGVLLATELFDVADEPTQGGGTRTIYRINERYELHVQRDPPTAVAAANDAPKTKC
ncbi:hypothetical protein ACVNIS_08400 [Sphaerotilaceae bacterium SBD11-9]